MANEYERERKRSLGIYQENISYNISNTSKMLCIKSNHIFLQEYMMSLEACKSKIMFAINIFENEAVGRKSQNHLLLGVAADKTKSSSLGRFKFLLMLLHVNWVMVGTTLERLTSFPESNIMVKKALLQAYRDGLQHQPRLHSTK